MTTHSTSVFAGIVFLCLIVIESQVKADEEPKELALEVRSTNPFVTDPFEPALNWRLSEDAETLVLERFGEPVHRSVAEAWSRNPYIEMEETTLLYPDVQFVLVGQVGSDFKNIRRIRVFGEALLLRHSIRIGMSPRELAEALGMTWDRSVNTYPISLIADYRETNVANGQTAGIHSQFYAHVTLGTVQYMSWDFLQD